MTRSSPANTERCSSAAAPQMHQILERFLDEWGIRYLRLDAHADRPASGAGRSVQLLAGHHRLPPQHGRQQRHQPHQARHRDLLRPRLEPGQRGSIISFPDRASSVPDEERPATPSWCVRREWSRTAVGWPVLRGGGNLYASWNRISKAGQHTDHQPTIAEEREGRAIETA